MDMMGKNTAYCYTQEEAEKRYGKDEGREFGDDVMVCGCKLPKKRAVKFMKLCGASTAAATLGCQFVMLHHTCKQPPSLMQAAIAQCQRQHAFIRERSYRSKSSRRVHEAEF